MQSVFRSNVSGWVGLAGAAGALVSILTLSGCPGTLDPTLFTTGTGGSSSGGSGSGTGGSNATGGSTGTGGAAANCTGSNDGATLVTNQCAYSGCHDTADAANFAAGLDLTINATIASRLVDVVSPGDTAGSSACGGNTEPYLKSGSNPATGLLVQKILSSPKCSPSESPPAAGPRCPTRGSPCSRPCNRPVSSSGRRR